MAEQGVWNPPINLTARVIDTQVVNGVLYVTYLSGGNYRVNQWEGGAGLSSPYFATQYYTSELNRFRLKNLVPTGQIGTLRVYAAQPGAPVPDVSDSGAAAASFTLSNTADQSEAEIWTEIEGRAFAFRLEFSSSDGTFQSLEARGIPKTERR